MEQPRGPLPAEPEQPVGHIARLRSELGTTVLLTTHYLEEADVLCDRVFIIDHGVIAAEGTPDELKRRISGDVVTLRVASGDHGTDAARKLLADQAVVREVSAADGAQADRGARRAGPAGAAPGARRGRGHAGVDQPVPAHPGRRVPHPDRALAA